MMPSLRRAKLPSQPAGWDVRATRSGGTYALRILPPGSRSLTMEGAAFFPAEKATLDHAAPQPVTQEGEAYLIALQQSEYAQEPADRLQGVLVAPADVGRRRSGPRADHRRTRRGGPGGRPIPSCRRGLDVAPLGPALRLRGQDHPEPDAVCLADLSIKVLGFAQQTPHMYVISPEGTLLYKGGIDDKPTTDRGDIETATNYVSAALDAAMRGEEVRVKTAPPYGCSVKYPAQ